ncbi:MAG: sigma-70 family RNA polymerase sigma factor [Candidatus Eiseniibacteriota bacterium]
MTRDDRRIVTRCPGGQATRSDDDRGTTLRALVARCRAGEEGAWSGLFERFDPLVYAVIRRCGLHLSDGADVYQRVALILYEKLHTIRQPEFLATWLITTTRRECLRERRRLDQECKTLDGVSLEVDPRDDLDRMIEIGRVVDAVERLGSPCRELLDLLFLDRSQPSYEEIAARLGLAIGSIGPMRGRCLGKLRRELAGRQREGRGGRNRGGKRRPGTGRRRDDSR